MGQLFLIAFRNLGTHKRRTLLLGGAIAGVTALLVILMGLSTGMKETMLESATTLMTGHVNVGGFYKVSAGQAAPVVTAYPKLLEQLRQEVPELDYAVQRGRGYTKLVSETGSVQVGLGGIDVANEPGFRKVIQVQQGKLDDLTQPNTLLIFEEQAKRLEVKVGDTITLSAPTMRGTNNTVDVRVAVIAANVGMLSSFNVFVPNSTLRGLYQMREDATGVLMLYLKDLSTIPTVQARLNKRLPELGYKVLDHNPQPFWAKFGKWTVQALDALTGLLIFVLLIIIAVGIMNTLWIAIRERTREIGTLRAIGMQRGWVLVMFVIEAMLLGMLGTFAGAVLGMLVCTAINAANVSVPTVVQVFIMSDKLQFAVQASSVVGSMVFITLCTTLISLVPSFLAARMKPVTAMHHIG
jgi:ABC-type lipoprotein release transport system permease subunit